MPAPAATSKARQRRRSSTSTATNGGGDANAAVTDEATSPAPHTGGGNRSSSGSNGGVRRSARLQAAAAADHAGQQHQRSSSTGKSGAGVLQPIGYFYMALLALQFGCQPMLVRAFIPNTLPKMVTVLATEGVKILLCLAFLCCERAEERARVWRTWSLKESVRLGALPAALYALQNTMAQVGYQNIDSLTFNLLNQTKTLAAAVCLYLVMGRRQTPLQLVALALLLSASIILNWPTAHQSQSPTTIEANSTTFYLGVLPVLLASATSGVCAALTQKTLQGRNRNSYLYSLELAAYGQICLLLTMLAKATFYHLSPHDDPSALLTGQLLDTSALKGWRPYTWIPIVTNAFGGVVVGLVTKHAGGVKKGFALIAGIALTAFVQAVVQATPPPPLHWLAAALVAVSTYMHSVYGPAVPKTTADGDAGVTPSSSKKRQ